MGTKVEVDAATLGVLRRAASANATPLSRRLFQFITYLGVGCLFHAWQLGPVFNQTSLWSWGYLLAWPVALLITVLQAMGWVVLSLIAVGLVIALVVATAYFGHGIYKGWTGR